MKLKIILALILIVLFTGCNTDKNNKERVMPYLTGLDNGNYNNSDSPKSINISNFTKCENCSLQKAYGLYFGINLNITGKPNANWTDRELKAYFLGNHSRLSPFNITYYNITRIYKSDFDIPLEDDCLSNEITGNDTICFVKWEFRRER